MAPKLLEDNICFEKLRYLYQNYESFCSSSCSRAIRYICWLLLLHITLSPPTPIVWLREEHDDGIDVYHRGDWLQLKFCIVRDLPHIIGKDQIWFISIYIFVFIRTSIIYVYICIYTYIYMHLMFLVCTIRTCLFCFAFLVSLIEWSGIRACPSPSY